MTKSVNRKDRIYSQNSHRRHSRTTVSDYCIPGKPQEPLEQVSKSVG